VNQPFRNRYLNRFETVTQTVTQTVSKRLNDTWTTPAIRSGSSPLTSPKAARRTVSASSLRPEPLEDP
jgi:hypothetical protein